MKDASTSSYYWTGHLSEGHTYLNSDNDHNFYNDNDNSNDDDDNNNDIYNNDKSTRCFPVLLIFCFGVSE